jgi:hypothetical protein
MHPEQNGRFVDVAENMGVAIVNPLRQIKIDHSRRQEATVVSVPGSCVQQASLKLMAPSGDLCFQRRPRDRAVEPADISQID